MLGAFANKIKEIVKKITFKKIDEKEAQKILEELKLTLLEADIDFETVNNIINSIKSKLRDIPPTLTLREYLIKLIYDNLVEILGKEKYSLIGKKKIMLVGLFGSGKTTVSAKLANYLKKKGLKVLLVCLDYHRPAAPEQLKQLAEKINVNYLIGKDAYETAKKSLELEKEYDSIIYDTAGRNALDKELAQELKNLSKIINPNEVLLVIPADLGKVAKVQAQEFNKLVGITGIIVTKLDSTAKAGAAIIACSQTNAKVKFISYGEKIDAFDEYDPKSFISRILGLGDLDSLLKKVKETIKEEEIKEIEEFNFETFLKQIEYIKKLGSMKQIISYLPGLSISLPDEIIEMQEEKIKKWKAIIQSMTKEERKNPKILNDSRIKRIAKGSGTSEQEVRELISQFKKMQKIAKMFKGFDEKKLSSMLQKFGFKFKF